MGPESERPDVPSDADAEVHDELPEDLDVTALVGPYKFPDVARRRWFGVGYLVVAAGVFAWGLTGPSAMVWAGILFALIGGYHLLAGWHLRVDEREALVVATRAVGFPVGHASAQLTWRGLRSRPTWRVLLYSADDPPTRRGLVELDGVDGSVLGQFSEGNPEDWSQYRR